MISFFPTIWSLYTSKLFFILDETLLNSKIIKEQQSETKIVLNQKNIKLLKMAICLPSGIFKIHCLLWNSPPFNFSF